MVRRSAWEQVGPQDERLYMYQDERDFAIRMEKAGFKEAVLTEAHAWHQHINAPNCTSRPDTATYYSARNKILVTHKHFGLRYAITEFLFDLVYTTGLATYHTITFQFRKLRYSRTVLRAIVAGILGKSGKAPSNI